MSQKPRSEFTRSEFADGAVRYAIVGDLVADRREMFKQHVRTDLAAGVRTFVFDFGRCSYVDSSGLGALVTVSKRIREAGGTLVLEQLNDDLHVLLQLTKLDTLFEIRERAPDPAPRMSASSHIGEVRDA
jgi:anti-sigma B factor antagonist